MKIYVPPKREKKRKTKGKEKGTQVTYLRSRPSGQILLETFFRVMNTGGNNHARWHVSPRREQKQPDTRSSNEATEKFQRAKYTSER